MSHSYIDSFERMRRQRLHDFTWGPTPTKKTAVAQSKNRGEKKGSSRIPGKRCFDLKEEESTI
ncbi:hypothetical protein ACFQ09_05350, partial [Massilia norwichensis]|uniref:hypothetical protein n=1 Tax=Massilia norwichensis TaxID=1442366 RepID=UPI003640A61B